MSFLNIFSSSENLENLKPEPDHPLASWLKIPRLHEALPYESYDEGTQLFFNKESTGFVLLAEPLAGASLQDQGHLADFFRQKENLPEGTSMQFLLYASPRIGPILKKWEDARVGIFKELAHNRTAYLREKAFKDEAGNILRDYRLIISYTVPGHVLTPVEQTQLLELRKNLMGVLGLIGVPSRVMDAEDLLREVSNIFNQGDNIDPERVFWNKYESLSKQIVSPDRTFLIKEDGVELQKGGFLRTYIPKNAPDLWALPHMDRFLGDILKHGSSVPCPFFLHYGFFVEGSQGAARKKLMAKSESLENALKNNLTKWVTGLEDEFKEVRECFDEVKKGERFIASLLSVSIFSSKEGLSQNEGKLKYIWNEAGWEIVPATFDHLPIFLGSMPMTWTGEA